MNLSGGAATLTFCFSKSGVNYGLTVGHLANALGERIFAFKAGDPDPSDGIYHVTEIGVVVSLNPSTDSLIIKIKEGILIEPFQIAAESGLRDPIQIPDWNQLPPLAAGTLLVGYGAQRRGAVGRIHQRFSMNRWPLLPGDIAIASFDPQGIEQDGAKQLSDEGDCGMLFLDEQGIPWAMHHVRTSSAPGQPTNRFQCFGVPLGSVIESHPAYFAVRETTGSHQGTTVSHQSSTGYSPIGIGIAEAPLVQFKTKEEIPGMPNFTAVAPLAQINIKIVDLSIEE